MLKDHFDGVSGNWPSFVVIGLWVICGFVVYLLAGNLVSLLLLGLHGVSMQDLVINQQQIIANYGSEFLGGNAIGLALGLGGVAILASWLDSSRPLKYLRITKCTPIDLGLSCLGYFGLVPIVLGAGILNEQVPLPEILQQMEEQQMVIVEWLTSGGGNFGLNLLLVAVTPAVFEEVFFRGFLQRRAERAMGIVGGILFTGILFGLFHLRLTQVIPFAVLGCYFAYLTWSTGSLLIPIILHFLNNGMMLAISKWGDQSIADPEVIPWLFVFTGGIVFIICIIFIHRNHEQRQH
ncbi:MAG: type II CAAX endopeptidase family protein [Bacteroidetes bacterium]|nr:type II CAAX endopeptidase family protein [Bacteroidota bacterium]